MDVEDEGTIPEGSRRELDPPTQVARPPTSLPRQTLPASPPPAPETPAFDPLRRWMIAGAAFFGLVAFACGLLYLRPRPAALAALRLEPAEIASGKTARGTVLLTQPAPPEGATITLRSLREDAATIQPGTVTIPSGQRSADFQIAAVSVTADAEVPLRATLGESSIERTLTVRAAPVALDRVELRPDRILAGTRARGTVFLTGPAPGGGAVIALAVRDGATRIDNAVRIGGGGTSAEFVLDLSAAAGARDVPITFTYNGVSKTATLHLLTLDSLTLDPPEVVAGEPAKATVTLSGEAPEGGIAVTLEAGEGAAVPANVTIPAGQRSAAFDITTAAGGTEAAEVTLTATAGNLRREAKLILKPASASEPLRVGRVRLLQPAPEGDEEGKVAIEFGGSPPVLESGATFAVEVEFTGGPLDPDSVSDETFFVEQDGLAAAGERLRGRIVRLPDGRTVRWVSRRRAGGGRYHVTLKGSGSPAVTAQGGAPLDGGDFRFDLDVR